MTEPEEKVPSQNMATALALKLVLTGTSSHFKSSGLIDDRRMDMASDLARKVLVETQKQSRVRALLGLNSRLWEQFRVFLANAIPALENQSYAVNDAIASRQNASPANLALSFTRLQKDTERVNDLCMIARNMLVTKYVAQDHAANARFHQQILRLIDLCVRVTVKGYDGDGGVRFEERWQKIATGFKRMLITCLQFLNNFVTNNERRKLLLWMDLFAGTPEADLNFMSHIDASAYDERGLEEQERTKQQEDFSAALSTSDAKDKDALTAERERLLAEKVRDLKNELSELSLRACEAEASLIRDASDATDNESTPRIEAEEPARQSMRQLLDTQAHEDVYSLRCTTSQAGSNLQAAKDQLVERLRQETNLHFEPGSNGSVGADKATVPDLEPYHEQEEAARPELARSASLDEDEDASQASVYRDRGLLTDIPLVLGPNEIEALPMIIQAGIVDAFASPNPGGIKDNMQAIRCNILMAQESGRNLFRELLIFIAAWDLVEESLYFKIMMQITEAVFKNGLVPFTFQSFAETKDIVSPAQAVFVKLLTQIFRAKQGLPNSSPPPAMSQETASRVDVLTIRHLFSQFREFVIPETCALIYLQGQVRKGIIPIEDFPLNLWDMERVYEGVYQFLEFFAVLSESEGWKKVLVEWEVTFELVTLLSELEQGIPKGQLLPRTATAGASHTSPETINTDKPANTPVAVERPYEVAPPSPDEDSPSGASSTAPLGTENPEEFEWRNLKKLVILVLSSLVWKSPKVQNQVRNYGGVEMVLQCCNFDSSNPYIREHAIMCLRFLLEGNEANMQIVRELEARHTVPSEVLDKRGYETFIDDRGKVGLRRKDGFPPATKAEKGKKKGDF